MNTVTESSAESVGAILRQSREAKGLSTAQVARQLNLKVAVIEQIEAEQWDATDSVTFMRGYLRAYARLMKLSEKEILQSFELQTAYLRQQPRPMHSFSKKTSLDAAENRFMLVTYLLIVLLIGLFLVWFWQTHLLDSEPVSVVPEHQATSSSEVTSALQPIASSISQTNDASLQAQQPELMNDVVALDDESNAVVSQSDTTTPAATPAATPTATSLATTPPAATATPVEVANATLPNPAPTATTDSLVQTVSQPTGASSSNALIESPQSNAAETPVQTTNSAVVTTATETMPNVAGLATLNLTFTADCWLEVYDKNNRRLAFGTQGAGKQLSVQGELPFRVTLGNPPAASMQLNDVVVDLSAYPAGRVARINLTGQP